MAGSRALTLLLVTGLGAGVLAGCSEQLPGVGATPSAPPVVRASGPLADPDSPRRVVYDERLVSDPLPARSARSARSAMSANEAVRAATRTGVSPDQQPGTPSSTLRLVSAGSGDGAKRVAKPTWVLTWRNSAPAVRGPVGMSEQERKALIDSLECVFVVTVDPESKAATNSAQFCERK